MPQFLQFVKRLFFKGALVWGNIFVADNCTLHFIGYYAGLRNTLFQEYGVLMMNLPPYHLELNPTELVFNTLLQRLTPVRGRYNSLYAVDYKHDIELIMSNFDLIDVFAFYEHSGYI